ncbi:MAG: addiction module protein [Flavobacteriales bacterium]|nr:addiction module protein [Flavobacteriales bacterium]
MNTKSISSLSESQKILLAEELWDSVSKDYIELSSEIKEELELRLKRLENQEVKLYSWQEVKNNLQKIRK